MRFAPLALLATLLFPPGAKAQQTTFGYQLGVTQSAATNVGDIQGQFGVPNDDAGAGDPATTSQLQGLQLTTGVNGNITLDIATRLLRHAIVAGVGFTQLFQAFVPDNPQLNAQQTTAINANASYLALIQRARYSFSFGAGYGFALNGFLPQGADGNAQGLANDNIPGARVSSFSFSGQNHTANASAVLQLTPSRFWDARLSLLYNHTRNGVFTLAPGGVGNQGAQGALGTNTGAFVIATVHSFNPALQFRRRVGRRGTVNAALQTTYALIEDVEDDVTVQGIRTTILAAQPPLPETILNVATLSYTYNFRNNHAIGLQTQNSLNFRIPGDINGTPFPGATFQTDTLITDTRVTYQNELPWELRLNANAGVAVTFLFQPPIGEQAPADGYEAQNSGPLPVFNLQLTRRFEPVDVIFAAGQTVAVGALGASALIARSASLAFSYSEVFAGRRLQLNVGFNANENRAVTEDNVVDTMGTAAPPGVDQGADDGAADLGLLAVNTRGFGVIAGFGLPLFNIDQFAADIAANYAFNFVQADPGGDLDIEPTITHTALASLRVTFGRGPAQQVAGAGGRSMTDELDAFNADPRSGSPLLTTRLLMQGAPLELGARPGEEVRQRRDSRQAIRASLLQQEAEQKARARANIVQSIEGVPSVETAEGSIEGVGSSAEEARAAEKEEQREKDEKREEELEKESEKYMKSWPKEDSVELPVKPKK